METVPWDKPAFLAKNPLAGAHLPVDQARNFQEPMHEKFVHCIGSTRRLVREQREQQDNGTADDQRRRNTEGARQMSLHSAEAAMVLPARAHALQDRPTQ